MQRVSEPQQILPLPDNLLRELLEVASFLHQRGWTPATSSNFSARTSCQADSFWISASGQDKGQLTPTDFLEIHLEGQVLSQQTKTQKPSAETRLHAMIYQYDPQAQAVLHTHSLASTVVSKLYEEAGQVVFHDFEILKGLKGVTHHTHRVTLPIFPNAQDIGGLAHTIQRALVQRQDGPFYGFLLAGHGLYTWGDSLQEAKRHGETLEFLLSCHLELKRHGHSFLS